MSAADSSVAWRALLSAWNLPTGDDDVAIATQCAASLAPEVFCLRARGNLDALATIGRPVLLRLRAGRRDAWAMLVGADATDVRLRVDDSVVELPRVALQRAVERRIHRDLAPVARRPVPASPSDLRDFQASHGILADGVIGPETRFALSSSGAGPHLLTDLR
jgi:general secretion pathway protein A